MALARLAALRFFLLSFFRGRWCSFAQMGLSLEKLTRPRNTIVTNFFIIPSPLFQKSKLTFAMSLSDSWKHEWRVHRKRAADETWGEKTHLPLVQFRQGGGSQSQNKREGGRGGQRESRHLRVMGGVQTNLSTGNRTCARSCNTKDSS